MTQACLFSPETLRPGRAWPFAPLEPMAYDCVMIDPPWRFENYSAKGEAKGPEPHYRTMTDDEILALPVAELLAANAMVWLWATWPKLPLAVACIERWSLTYVTGGAWNKRRWGTGYVLRSVSEPFLIATCGEPKIDGRGVPNLIEESRRGHSRKPESGYAMCERMMPAARRADVFSRVSRKGWEATGDECGKFDGEPLCPTLGKPVLGADTKRDRLDDLGLATASACEPPCQDTAAGCPSGGPHPMELLSPHEDPDILASIEAKYGKNRDVLDEPVLAGGLPHEPAKCGAKK